MTIHDLIAKIDEKFDKVKSIMKDVTIADNWKVGVELNTIIYENWSTIRRHLLAAEAAKEKLKGLGIIPDRYLAHDINIILAEWDKEESDTFHVADVWTDRKV